MSTQKIYENIKELLKKHKQDHLLALWDQLKSAQRQNLLAQIQRLDLEKIDFWVANFVKKSTSAAINADFTPALSYNPEPADTQLRRKYAKAVDLGKKLIRQSKVAAFVVAGGQGTRRIP